MTHLSPKISEQITRIAEVKSVISHSVSSQKEIIALGFKVDALSVRGSINQNHDLRSVENTLSGLSVLIVDDEIINQRILSRMLEKAGCQYQVANNGREALNKIATNKFDVVLMDVCMPEMDGLTATRAIEGIKKSHGLSAPVIIGLSANVNEGHVKKGKEAGMVDYIPKPYTKEAILSAINKHTRQAHSHRQNGSTEILNTSPSMIPNIHPAINPSVSYSSSSSPSTGANVSPNVITRTNLSPSTSPNPSGLPSVVIDLSTERKVSPGAGKKPQLLNTRFTDHKNPNTPALPCDPVTLHSVSSTMQRDLPLRSIVLVDSKIGFSSLQVSTPQSVVVRGSCCSSVATSVYGFYSLMKQACCCSDAKVSPAVKPAAASNLLLGN